MLSAERIRWIERWCKGWENAIDPNAYETMSLAVAIGFVRELLEQVRERDAYRIEADEAMRDYEALEMDVRDVLGAIANPRPNQPFDPWARDTAQQALDRLDGDGPPERILALVERVRELEGQVRTATDAVGYEQRRNQALQRQLSEIVRNAAALRRQRDEALEALRDRGADA
jgi:hypothetical protein